MLPPKKENLINRQGIAVGLPVTPIVGDVNFDKNKGDAASNTSGIDMWQSMLAQPKE